MNTNQVTDPQVWEAFVAVHPEANFLQSWGWGEFHQALGHSIHRTGFFENETLVGVMLSVVEPAKRGRYLTIPAGPIIDWQNTAAVNAFVTEAQRIAKAEDCVFVRVRPQLKSNTFSEQLFRQLGFVSAPMHLHAELTSQLDITAPEETLLMNMRKATRYEIKKAQKIGVTVEASTDPAQLKAFYDLQVETSKRQDFVPFSYEFLSEQFKVFAAKNQALMFTAKFENEVLAQAFIIFYNTEAAYHYGASTLAGRKYPGAYLIQWQAILEAKKRGLTRYNFWGVAPETETEHRFANLSLFKRGFGGSDFAYLHAQDLVMSKLKYALNVTVENVRKKIRRV